MKHINRVLLYDLQRIKPDAIAVESYIMNQKEVFVRDGKINVMRTRQVMMAYGVILETIAEYGLEPYFYTPSQVKATATLYGQAGKGEVAAWVGYALGVASSGEHIDDARAVGITHIAKTMGATSAPINVEELVQ
jgi:Holliday junction resolvasome RuvABC endonuclease subunit